MSKQMHLVKPSIDFREAYIAFYEEWKASGEPPTPWVIGKDPSNFSEMLHYFDVAETEEGASEMGVPHSTYWLTNEEEKVVGAVNIRHRLNERLLERSGHIGYGIRPSERRKGYATAILSLALEKTKEMGIDRVLVICDKGNIGSEKTILNNGGVFESDYTLEDGDVIRRFWIEG